YSGKKILMLFHGTEHGSRSMPGIDYEKDNIYTVDIDKKVKPTIVGDATSLSEGAPLMLFDKETFDIIVVYLCRCHVWDSVLKVGQTRFIGRLVELLKTDELLYIRDF